MDPETHDNFFARLLAKVERDLERARGEPLPWHRFNDEEVVLIQELLLAGHSHASTMQHANTVWLGFRSPTGLGWELVHNEGLDTWTVHTTTPAFEGALFGKTGYKDPRKLIKEFLAWENDR